jgi:hypothetical protein
VDFLLVENGNVPNYPHLDLAAMAQLIVAGIDAAIALPTLAVKIGTLASFRELTRIGLEGLNKKCTRCFECSQNVNFRPAKDSLSSPRQLVG